MLYRYTSKKAITELSVVVMDDTLVGVLQTTPYR